MKTYSQKGSEVKREWWLIDASSMPLGKLAVVIADKLMGKSKVTYTPHIDNGDYVVVINAKDLVVTGDKMTQKKYYRHSGFPGGIKELSLEEVISKDPSRAITEAVKGMIETMPDADKRIKAAELAAFELDKIIPTLEDEKLQAIMKEVTYNTLNYTNERNK